MDFDNKRLQSFSRRAFILGALQGVVDNIEIALNKLSNIIDIEQWRIDQAIEKSQKMASFLPVEVRDRLSWDEVSKLDPLLKAPAFKIGKTGLEKDYDLALRGKAGNSNLEVNVRGRAVREIDKISSVKGKSITLTIDAELQRYVQDRLAQHKSASAIIMDSKTGAVYAMASHPSFDPNLFTGGISTDQWQEILNNPAFPLNNKALTGQYPPGSTFKMITSLAALEGLQWPKIDVSQKNLDIVKKGMDLVVNHEDGTAYATRYEDETYSFGGKTGTAQVKKIDRKQRALGIMNEDLDWRFRHHALFVGYAPLINPRYVCSVVVEHGGGGSAVAAPIASDILLQTQKRNPAFRDA